MFVPAPRHPRGSHLPRTRHADLNGRVSTGPLLLHVRSSVRAGWRSLLAIALLFGLAAGLSSAALASTRRTADAYDRLLAATKSSDLSVDYGAFDPQLNAGIAALPGIADTSTSVAFNAAALDARGRARTDIPNDFETVGSLDGRFFDNDRVSVLAGRLPDPNRVDEVAINESMVRQGLRVGERLTLGIVTDEEIESAEDVDALVPTTRESVTIVGEILFSDEVIQDDNDVITRLLATPAFAQKYAEEYAAYSWEGLRLEPDASPNTVSADVRRYLISNDPEDPGFTLIRTVAEDQARVERAILPQLSALLFISALVAIVAVVLVQQAAARQIRTSENDFVTYRSFGLTPRAMTLLGMAPPLLAVAVGAVLAAGAAYAASARSPVGALHRVEPAPGLQFDWVALLGTIAGLAVVSALGIAVAARASTRRTSAAGRSTSTTRSSRLAKWVRSAGAPVSVSVGAGYALQPQAGPNASPVRTITAGTTVAVAALVASLCFGSSLDRLLNEPRLYGWNWDVALIDQAGYGSIDTAKADEVFGADPDVEGWAPLGIASTDIDNITVPIIAVRPQDRVGPAILTGRMARSNDEIVLGRTTMRALKKHLGDTVSFGPRSTRMRIVGTATLPAIGQVHSSHPSPGEGAITFNSDSLISASSGEGQVPVQSDAAVAVVRFRPGVDQGRARQRLRAATSEVGEYPGSSSFLDVSRPAEIINARSITIAPTITSGLLMFTALLSLSLTLVAGVRRRRVDFAALKALGFTRRQIGATILTQSVIVTAIGLAIGVPAGIIGGRWAWALFAERMSVVDSASVPVTLLVVVMCALAVGSVLVAVLPSQIASRVRAGDTLSRS